MPWTDIAILCAILAAFASFGLALAYGQHQTRDVRRASGERPAAEPPAEAERKLAA